ncbi:MAG: AAA family ATPase [Desulfobulbaceae bacterium]|nr:AAA family ATPase [Desulfobulbaceae bacterium]
MKILAIYSGKGGVGKTATAVNLASVIAQSGQRVLLCDMDSQGAASYYFRILPKKKYNSRKLLEGKFDKYIKKTEFANLDLLPAHFSFRNLDLALSRISEEGRTNALLGVFSPLQPAYDYLVLDCPPTLTILGENIIEAADVVITPVIPTSLSVLALQRLLKLFKKKKVSEKKIVAFFSMVEKRKTMHNLFLGEYGDTSLFLSTRIPFMAEIEKMGLFRNPVGTDGKVSPAAEQYKRLWQEILQRGDGL